MISAKFIVLVWLVALFVAVGGFLLELAGIEWGRYAIYLVVPIGAITGIIGVVATLLGKIKDDLRK